jgi:hypothetical protein
MTIRRLKTYTGSQGYVYQYYFVGKRLAATSDAHESDATEYIFDVTSDRKLTYSVSIFLPHEVVAAWAESHGRPLADSEQYAAVKMRLFRAAGGAGRGIDPAGTRFNRVRLQYSLRCCDPNHKHL